MTPFLTELHSKYWYLEILNCPLSLHVFITNSVFLYRPGHHLPFAIVNHLLSFNHVKLFRLLFLTIVNWKSCLNIQILLDPFIGRFTKLMFCSHRRNECSLSEKSSMIFLNSQSSLKPEDSSQGVIFVPTRITVRENMKFDQCWNVYRVVLKRDFWFTGDAVIVRFWSRWF